MVKKGIIWGTLLLLVITSILVFNLAHGSKKVSYGIELPKDNFDAVAVNDTTLECSITKEEAKSVPENFKKVAENSQLELYLEEASAAIAVADKCNGYTWYSYDADVDFESENYSADIMKYIKSGLSLVTYDKNTTVRRTVLDSDVVKTYEMLENGFKVNFDFTSAQIKFDLYVLLQDGDLIVRVPEGSVEEYNPKLWKPGNNNISIHEIVVYPFLGSIDSSEDGYVVIPDGSGAIVNLEETPKYIGGYSAAVYGEDKGYQNTILSNGKGLAVKPMERISMPIFGIIHQSNKAGLMVISEAGTSYATYNYNSRDLTTKYYQSYFAYNYRTEYAQFQSRSNQDQFVLAFQEKPNPIDLVQRYVFLRGEDANYVGMAKKYQDFLVKKEGLTKTVKPLEGKIPMKIDFINNEIAMGTLGVEDVPVTSYKQAQEIIEKLLERDYQNLNVTFKTFLQDLSTYQFDVMAELGGKEEFTKALEFFNDHNVKFSYYVDYVQSYYEKTEFTASKLNRQDFSFYNSDKMLLNYVNNPKYYQLLAEKDVADLEKTNVTSLALDGLTESLFTHYDDGVLGNSLEGMEYMKGLFKYLQENEVETHAYTPDAYLYPFISDYYNAPLVSSELMFIDETIPLVPLVLNGYKNLYSTHLNFSSNDEDSILKLIEFGVYPSFVLTADTTYDLKKTASGDVYVSQLEYLSDRIDTYYMTVNSALQSVVGEEMINHSIIEDGIVKVEYSNGTVFIINYTNADYLYENTKIKSKGFVIL